MTGNFTRPAQIKLEHFGLWRFFHFGAYGDDAPVRDELVLIAVERARRVEKKDRPVEPAQGETPEQGK